MVSQTKSVMDLFSLDGHVAMVVGGSRGLGRAMAGALAEAGAATAICSRSRDACDAAAAAIAEKTNRPSVGIAMDVTREEDVDRAFEEVISRFGKLDVLINSAGINARHLIEDCPAETFREVIDTNLGGCWLTCRAAARLMKPRRYGSVINMGSALSSVALPMRTPYCSSKFGLIGLTRALALEWAESGVRCNAICPGPFMTEMNRPLLDDPEKARAVVSQTAMNRWGEIHEIVGAAVFLASPASTYVTGASLYVDGGWTAR
ncbi:MAG: SDR family oxidoreductase [Phycisphaerae bacterium]